MKKLLLAIALTALSFSAAAESKYNFQQYGEIIKVSNDTKILLKAGENWGIETNTANEDINLLMRAFVHEELTIQLSSTLNTLFVTPINGACTDMVMNTNENDKRSAFRESNQYVMVGEQSIRMLVKCHSSNEYLVMQIDKRYTRHSFGTFEGYEGFINLPEFGIKYPQPPKGTHTKMLNMRDGYRKSFLGFGNTFAEDFLTYAKEKTANEGGQQ